MRWSAGFGPVRVYGGHSRRRMSKKEAAETRRGCLIASLVGVVMVIIFGTLGWPALVLGHHRVSGEVRWGAEIAWILLVLAGVLVLANVGKRQAARSVVGTLKWQSLEPGNTPDTLDVELTITTDDGKLYSLAEPGVRSGNPFLSIRSGDRVTGRWNRQTKRMTGIRKL